MVALLPEGNRGNGLSQMDFGQLGEITIYGQMEIKFQFGIGRPFPNANIQVWKWNSISKNYNIIT